ncbi:hypothetical protein RB653_001841 [Dictyostelium firmibasis]|uniref:Uncharacterized protein n=1 Tax=Dictyostelium firmibasis TaxID=79012 RepID=A0AAN7YMI5_9MYCE
MGKRKSSSKKREKEVESFHISDGSKKFVSNILSHISSDMVKNVEIHFLTKYEDAVEYTMTTIEYLAYQLDVKKFKLDPPKAKKPLKKKAKKKQMPKVFLEMKDKKDEAKSNCETIGNLIKIEKDEYFSNENKLEILAKKKDFEKIRNILRENEEMEEKENEKSKEIFKKYKSNFLSKKYEKYEEPFNNISFLVPIENDFSF